MSSAMPSSLSIFDLLCVGFGPASLALAVALVEQNQQAQSVTPNVYSSLGGLQEALRDGSELRNRGSEPNAASADPADRPGIKSTSGPIKVCFIEKHDTFRWHPGMMLDGSTMQISFLKDLATLRNPQSAYTFLSYLASFTPSRLVSFISRETFTPSRREYTDYLAWAARKVEAELESQNGEFGYGEEVVGVEGVMETGADVKLVKVTSRSVATGELKQRLVRNLVLSTGGYARLPKALNAPGIRATGRVIHSSVFLDRVQGMIDSCLSSLPASRPLKLASFGSGQSAAETFLAVSRELAARLPHDIAHRPEITLFIRKATLRPADDSPFSNEVFDPAMSQAVYGLEPRGRQIVMSDAKATNYSVVNPKTLLSIYEAMYAQQVEEDIAKRDGTLDSLKRSPKLIIHPYTELVGATTSGASPSSLTLVLRNLVASTVHSEEFDAVVCGTGYDRQAWKGLLFSKSAEDLTATPSETVPLATLFELVQTPSPLDWPSPSEALHASDLSDRSQSHSRETTSANESPLFSNSAVSSSAASSPAPSRGSYQKADKTSSNDYGVTESYRLRLPTKTVDGGDFKPRIWLQGSCESTHGISDSLLSVLAVRSGEVVADFMKEGSFD
ncbi:BQ5605_C009g05701 [Microbotryum silenes-dioicae]|uniref:L-ornithine N(5)-monooxygenase [NAD(P)H] n=1 Tax=Microbotryum silenes-dioicae TaxID=796604 RepID=A0A2X0MI21_9BASI|nr:BQ5605_C009g05701 [Microbotryum silenes-dioicae]